MKIKEIIIIGFLINLNLAAENYKIKLSSNINNVIVSNLEKDNIGKICEVRFGDAWSNGQYESISFANIKFKLDTGNYYDYGVLSNVTNESVDFEGGKVLGISYKTNRYWKTDFLIKSGYYFLGRISTNSKSKEDIIFTFNEGINIREVSYSDNHEYGRYTNNYNVVLNDCEGNEVFREVYTTKQSKNVGDIVTKAIK